MSPFARKYRFLWRTILLELDKFLLVQPPRILTPEERLNLEESSVALTNWTRAGLSLRDVQAFMEAGPEGKAIRALRMLEGVSRLDAPGSHIGEVLAYISLFELLECAVKGGLDFCPGAIAMLRTMDQNDVDDFLNEAVSRQVDNAPVLAARNAEVMERLGISMNERVADTLSAYDHNYWP